MEKKRPAIYLDTSVFGGYFDKKFDTITQKLFDNIMKTKRHIIKGFKAVEFMRKVRDEISRDIKDMNCEETLRYFEERQKLFAEKIKARKKT